MPVNGKDLAAARAAEREVVQLLRASSFQLAQDVSQLAIDTIPAYDYLATHGALQSIRESTLQLIEGFVSMLLGESETLSEDFFALTRQRAREGVPVEAVLEILDLGNTKLWKWLNSVPGSDAESRLAIWDKYMSFVGSVRIRVSTVYREERAALGDAGLIVANHALESLLANPTGDTNSEVLGQFGLETPQIQIVSCVYPESERTPGTGDVSARLLTRVAGASQTSRGVRPPWIIRKGRIVIVTEARDTLVDDLTARMAQMPHNVSAGLSQAMPISLPLDMAYSQSETALRNAVRFSKPLASYAHMNLLEIGAEQATIKPDNLPAWAQRFLDIDEPQSQLYRDTIVQLFQSGGNPKIAAHALHVHTNTIYYRLKSLTDQIGIDTSKPDSIAQIYYLINMV